MDENQEQAVQQGSYNKYSQRSSDPFDLPEEFAMITAADEARRQQAKLDNGEIKTTELQTEKKTKIRTKKIRSKHYKNLKTKVDPKQKLSPKEAIELLLKLSKEKFDSSFELNLVSKKDVLSGTIDLPFGTGKQKKVVIFSDEILKQIEAKEINFDVLIAKPEDMGNLLNMLRFWDQKVLCQIPKTELLPKNPKRQLKI